MSPRGPRKSILPAAGWLTVGLAIGAPLVDHEGTLDSAPGGRPAAVDAWAPPAAVDALRAGDCDRAVEALAPEAAATTDAAVIAGLYLHACGEHASAWRQLRAASGYRGALADWRLWTLAESARQLGQPEAARRALAALAAGQPRSPLASPALASAAELALEAGDHDAVEALVSRGRASGLSAPDAARLETVALKSAQARRDPAALALAARRLLVDHPLTAAELEVVEIFRRSDGSVAWRQILSDEELRLRARRLLAADLAAAAVEALDRVDPAARGREWMLLRAEALTGARRGREALELLAGASGRSLEEETRIEWLRARAALEAAVARRGRAAGAAERGTQRRAAHHHLRRVVALAADDELSLRALRILFADLADEGRFEEAVATLRALRQIDPGDETGAGYLWRRGWRELERRNASSAVGYWTELRALYPDSTAARRALYWSARAHLELGNQERAQTLLRQVVAAPMADFYHRHAMEWLAEPPPAAALPTVPAAAWPRDAGLARARWLSDLGLDEAARVELELAADRADPRAVAALRAEILARQGDTRGSIVELRRAFPDLGTHRQQRAPAAALRLYYPLGFDVLVHQAAELHQLPPHLVFAMIRQESAFDSGAHSHAGARGLMQVMPATGRELARRLGLSYDHARLVDPGFSVQIGTAYYRQILRSFGDEELALAAYNGGPSRIRRWWRRSGDWSEVDRFIESLPFDETRTYVQRVVLLSNAYRDLYAG